MLAYIPALGLVSLCIAVHTRQLYLAALTLLTSTVVASQAKRPVLYVGGGCLEAAPELRAFVERTGIPVAQTLMGLGELPDVRLSMLHVIP